MTAGRNLFRLGVPIGDALLERVLEIRKQLRRGPGGTSCRADPGLNFSGGGGCSGRRDQSCAGASNRLVVGFPTRADRIGMVLWEKRPALDWEFDIDAAGP
jgi:hypothetical protein